MLCGCEGNRGSAWLRTPGHASQTQWYTYGLSGLGKGDEHPAYGPTEYGTFTLPLPSLTNYSR